MTLDDLSGFNSLQKEMYSHESVPKSLCFILSNLFY